MFIGLLFIALFKVYLIQMIIQYKRQNGKPAYRQSGLASPEAAMESTGN
jgi:hypothetical protein